MQIDKRKRYAIVLSTIQIATILLAISVLVLAPMIHRHKTILSQISIQDYFIGFHFATPPLALLIIGLLFSLFTGKSVKKYPSAIIDHLRNVLFQSKRYMLIVCVCCVVFLVISAYHLKTTPPAFYSKFVTTILQGASDDYRRAERMVDQLSNIGAKSAQGYNDVLQVFSLRSKYDFSGKDFKQQEIRAIVGSLEFDPPYGWTNNPLRWHTLGEAYSLYTHYAQKSLGIDEAKKLGTITELTDKCTDWYDDVYESTSCLATPKLKLSAMLNKGNLFYRRKDYPKMLNAWQLANIPPSTSAWGNVIMGLVLMKKYDQAEKEGKSAIEWAQENHRGLKDPSSYSSLYANTAFSQWMLEKHDEALLNCQEAITIHNDLYNKLNKAHAFILAGHYKEAKAYLKTFMKPIFADNQKSIIEKDRDVLPGYILWVLADPNATISNHAARLYAVRGDAREPDELNNISTVDFCALVEETIHYLDQRVGLCSDYMKVPKTKHLLQNLINRVKRNRCQRESVSHLE